MRASNSFNRRPASGSRTSPKRTEDPPTEGRLTRFGWYVRYNCTTITAVVPAGSEKLTRSFLEKYFINQIMPGGPTRAQETGMHLPLAIQGRSIPTPITAVKGARSQDGLICVVSSDRRRRLRRCEALLALPACTALPSSEMRRSGKTSQALRLSDELAWGGLTA